ncbi:MAG: AbrB/MazE/SpoVT family DNA-binding domain-containing protein [Mobiluncus porci]|uniref:AbrB/MazE/SpoVT family DNA-binding domain-containing protein n=1 Tax=Mobiluncus porci TaxID=2652278 RepID=A0A7K0K1J1_9ACTO|nr:MULTISPECIES: AbrB/MazE/SpoVT family DNA-binding domain-containing protein [Mobiluncus]MCI6584343.1 AbrB/MazE/SpoVT family DNA-binding domain-containing protein [Mobiluncus sp.]MDD7540658.1 AbrB/MazE/SpoVT family DNA-binding domain-containing protein [Mobiluncus porci]MDY5748221.1 AbrB/MazE/SpoVT family DNA-binding domain-containing protein [Mobiluncus porci]MST49289.1 AbrB/MazE/SpoVT family DNA-binding domain-containing protein [Mobiluncus porci]
MEAVIDKVGRLVAPKPLRDQLGLEAGNRVDISLYGAGLQITPGGRKASLEKSPIDGKPVAVSEATFNDDLMYELMDAVRRRPRR